MEKKKWNKKKKHKIRQGHLAAEHKKKRKLHYCGTIFFSLVVEYNDMI